MLKEHQHQTESVLVTAQAMSLRTQQRCTGSMDTSASPIVFLKLLKIKQVYVLPVVTLQQQINDCFDNFSTGFSINGF